MKLKLILLTVFSSIFISYGWADTDAKTQTQTSKVPQPYMLDLAYARILAGKNSADLQYITLRTAAQNRAFQLSLREFYPDLSLSFGSNDTINIASPDERTKSASITLNQLLFNGGRNLAQRKLARMQLILDSYTYQAKYEEIMDATWKYFYNLLLSREKKHLQQEILASTQKQWDISQKEFQLGSATEVDLVKTELEVKHLAMDLKKTEQEEDVQYYEFKKLLGLSSQDSIELKGNIDCSYTGLDLDPDPDYWYVLALSENIQLKQQEFELQKSRTALQLAKRDYLPSITASVSYALSGEDFPLQYGNLSFQLKFAFPFKPLPLNLSTNFSKPNPRQRTAGGGLQSEILPEMDFLIDEKLSLIDLAQKDLAYQEALDNLRFTIEQNLRSYRFAQENLVLREEALGLLKRQLTIQEKQLVIGEIKRLDFVEAQTEFLKEQMALLEDVLGLLTMERELEKTIGLEAGTLMNHLNPDPD